MADTAPVLVALSEPARSEELEAELSESGNYISLQLLDSAMIPGSLPRDMDGAFVFVDWLLPDMSGLELCRRLRDSAAGRRCHITLALDSPDADLRRRALAAGADDYLTGPLTAAAIVSRLGRNALPARPQGGPRRLVRGDLVIDLAAFQARYQERPLPLRPNELRLLAHFLGNPDQVFSRASLIHHLGKDGEAIDERTVDVWIGRLRRGLKAQGVADPLRTVRSLGYVLDSLPH